MNCFSNGLDVKRRCKSVPKSSVTKYLMIHVFRGNRSWQWYHIQIFQGRYEHILKANYLWIYASGKIYARCGILTFSCCMCFSNFNSRYVRLLRTGVLNGFMIFLIATGCCVSWSFAELYSSRVSSGCQCSGSICQWHTTQAQMRLGVADEHRHVR